MKKITWEMLDGRIPDCTLGRLMDDVGEETGIWPDWTDEVPNDIVKLVCPALQNT